MADFQSWLKRNKIGLFDTFLTQGGGGKRSRMSTRPMMWEDEALEKFTGEKYNNAMLQRGISEAVGRAFGEDRKAELARENQMLRSTLGQYRQATGGLARNLQRVSGEKQGATSPELDPYQMARQIPGMEGRKALTSGGGASNVYMVGTGMDPMAGSPEVPTGAELQVGPMDNPIDLTPTPPTEVLGYAGGGPLQRGAVHMVGEAGRELVVPRGDGGYQVIPNPQTEAVMATGGVNSPLIRHACGGRIKHHQEGGEIDDNRRYGEVIGPEIQGTPVYNTSRELRPMENINTILGRNQVAADRIEEAYPVGPVPEAGMGWSRRAGVVPGAGTKLPPVTSVYPGMATTPETYTAATEAARGVAGAGAETDRPVGRSYYDEMASQWSKPSAAATGPPIRRVDFSAPLARSRGVPGVTPLGSRGETEVIGSGYEGQPTPISRRNDVFYQQMGDAAEKGEIVEVRYGPNDVKYFNPAEYGPGRPFRSPEAAKRGGEVWEVSGKAQTPTTLIRGSNVTYSVPTATGEQEFSTPQMAREAAMYTPEAQAEMFELKRTAARQAVENLGTSPAADARMAVALARENSAWGRAKAQVEATSSKDNNGIPTLTIDRNGNTIVHPRHLPKAIGDITAVAPKVQTVNDGIQLAEQIRQTVAGHDPATKNRAFEALLGTLDNPGAGALPANVAKQVREYYARLRQQAAAQQTR